MSKIRLVFFIIGLLLTSMLFAQEVNSQQSGEEEYEGIKVGSRRNYSRTKAGFFAPFEMSLGVAYDNETPNFSYDEYSTKPLNGVRVNFDIQFPLIGILSLENLAVFRVNYVEDSQIRGNFTSLNRWDVGVQYGFLLSTGYNFKKFHLTVSGGALLVFCIDDTTLETNSGNKIEIGNMGFEDSMTKFIDIPISFAASFRYMRFGLRVNYDIGTINRYNKEYYEQTGSPESYTRKNNHFSIGIQYYFNKW